MVGDSNDSRIYLEVTWRTTYIRSYTSVRCISSYISMKSCTQLKPITTIVKLFIIYKKELSLFISHLRHTNIIGLQPFKFERKLLSIIESFIKVKLKHKPCHRTYKDIRRFLRECYFPSFTLKRILNCYLHL